MKTMRIKDTDGQPVKGWRFQSATGQQVGAFHGGQQLPARKMKGWELIAPDGYTRFHEGNWEQFAHFANMVLENHGYRPYLS